MMYSRERQPPSTPVWIICPTGPYTVRLPFDWDYVLELTSIGFRADRVGDTVVITGKPSNDVTEAPAS